MSADLRILLVEDADADADLVAAHARLGPLADAELIRAGRLDDGLALAARSEVDCVLLDLGLPDATGVDVVATFAGSMDVPIVVLTGESDERQALAAVASGAQDYLVKGAVGPELLARSVRYAIERHRAARERGQLEREVAAERDRLAEVQRIAAIGGWWVDLATGELHLAPESAALFGVALAGPHQRAGVIESVVANDRPRARELIREIAAGRPIDEVLGIVRPDGAVRRVHVRSAPHQGMAGRVWGTVQDVTEREELEAARRSLQARLQHAQRMETVGRLAGGVAHDFNNLLAVIGVGTSVARSALPADHPSAEHLALVSDAVERAAALTRQLLVFSRRDEPAPVVLSLGDVVRDLAPILRGLLGERIRLELDVGEPVATVRADRAQIEQVVVNLAVNARDAMPTGGRVTIEVTNRSGGTVALVVSDTGTGMPADVASRAFEPFFTTKPMGSGTGLGLATVYGIVERAGGEVRLDSAPGVGTSVEVILPVAMGDPVASATGPGSAPSTAPATVLVVDDNEQIAQLVEILLRQHGHDVVRATDGAAALAVAADLPALDLLVTDVVMAGMSGRELAVQLRRVRPDVAVVFISGYTADVFLDRELEPGQVFVRKPFTAEEILDAVAAALS